MSLDKLLEKPNIIIYFFMIGCPYCEKTKPVWDEFKSQQKGFEFAEIESADVPDEKKNSLGISGFPHFIMIKNGKRKAVSGSKSTVKELKNAFSLGSFSGGRSSRFRRRVRKTRRTRKTRRS
jgi:thiol-disulfide isomerase/thioredoxin